jgi:hypothetical protein
MSVLGNRVLRRIFGPKWEEVVGGWKRPHNEEVHYNVSVINSRKIRCVGHVAHMIEMKCCFPGD